jgi:autotransporter-associated beta strand protein
LFNKIDRASLRYLLIVAVSGTGFWTAAAHADVYWNGTGSTWANPNDWANPGSTAYVGASFSNSGVSGSQIVGLNGNQNADDLTFGQFGESAPVSITTASGDSLTLNVLGQINVNAGAGPVTIGTAGVAANLTAMEFNVQNSSANVTTINMSIPDYVDSGNTYRTAVSISGTGTVVLAGTNSFSNQLSISGTVAFSNESALGSSTYYPINLTGMLTSLTTQTIANHAFTGGGIINAGAGNVLTIKSTLSGVSGFTFNSTGAGTVILGGSNELEGASLPTGVLKLNNANALGNPFDVTIGYMPSTVPPVFGTISPATFDLNGYSTPTITNFDIYTATAASGNLGVITNSSATTAVITRNIYEHNAVPTIGGNAGDITIVGTINGLGNILGNHTGLTKVGTDTLTLQGASPYTGNTTVQGGKLLVTGSIAGAVAITGNTTFGNASLGGTGTIGGNVTVSSTGTNNGALDLRDGSIGTLTLDQSLTMGLGGNVTMFNLDLGASGPDLVSVSGTLTLDANVTVGFASLANLPSDGNYPIMTFSSESNASQDQFTFVNGLGVLNAGDRSFALVNTPTSELLEIRTLASAVPEPATLSLLMIGALPLLTLRRRSNKRCY